MARKRKKRSHRGIALTALLNLAIAAAAAIWFVLQPSTRKDEMRHLVTSYLDRGKRVSLVDVVRDIWTLYYSNQFVDIDFSGADTTVYGGIPTPTAFPHQVKTLTNRAYAAGYCNALKNPVWVGYRLVDMPGTTTSPERPDSFQVDRRTGARVAPGDYLGSGYDRGHLAPNFGIARCYGRQAQEETFLMSNIVPQTRTLNAGPWREIEMRTALNYTARFREIWVISGPVFTPLPPTMPAGIPIPAGCFTILVDEHEGRIRMLAFYLEQAAPANARPERYATSVDRIEALTGFDFFPEIDPEIQHQLESRVTGGSW